MSKEDRFREAARWSAWYSAPLLVASEETASPGFATENPVSHDEEGQGWTRGNLMTPHPGVARTLYLAKKDLITRLHSWTRILRSSVLEWETPIH
ncbi:uncharacterized protein LOC105422873 isoform X2 [Pogonomyrmex barbatus]|nr:uncharacterized protein LOC105422873 isoform X2 [Pogonomyrmex barbatus]